MTTSRIWPASAPALITDFYELTMMAGYFEQDRADCEAVFEYFFRSLPEHTGYCVFAGLEDLVEDLEDLHFDADAIAWLRSLGMFSERFLQFLSDFRFRGDVWAAPEGTPVFPNEPIARVHAPIAEAQLVETLLLNRLNYQSLVATKAAKVCFAADGEPVVDFGLRRAQGPDGGLSGSRAAYIGGCVGTSNVLAAWHLGIPPVGTMAHSWVMSYPTEKQAFDAYLQVFPENPILLIDTYDTAENGLPTAVEVFREWRERGWNGRAAVRLDSGDLAYLSKLAWQALTEAGFDAPLIVGSSSLNEDIIADLKRQGAKINSWGVGTELITGGDEPALGGVYKLAAVQENGRLVSKMKMSSNIEKTTDPGAKKCVRFYDSNGFAAGDVLFGVDEELPEDQPVTSHNRLEYARIRNFPKGHANREILHKVIAGGRRTHEPIPLQDIRTYAQQQIQTLRPELRRLRNPERYWVGLSTLIADEKAAEISRLTSGSM